jgi:hypothetical protein
MSAGSMARQNLTRKGIGEVLRGSQLPGRLILQCSAGEDECDSRSWRDEDAASERLCEITTFCLIELV